MGCMRAGSRDRLRVGDVVVAVIAALVGFVYVVVAVESGRVADSVLAALGALLVAATLVWRVWPVVAGVAIMLGLAAWAAVFWVSLPYNTGITPFLLLAPMVVYAWTRWLRSPGWGYAALGVAAVGSFASPAMRIILPQEARYELSRVVVHWAVLAAAYLLAARQRSVAESRERELAIRAEREEALRQRNAALAELNEALEGEAERRESLAVQMERTRVAREIHDVLAHSLTLIHAQATAGLVAASQDPDVPVSSMRTIRSVAKDALGDVRGIVGTLRGDESESSTPAGDLRGLPDVVARFRDAGLDVDAELPPDGDLEEWGRVMPAMVRLALLRVVQEGLANVLRHGTPEGKTRLELVGAGGWATVQITNRRPRHLAAITDDDRSEAPALSRAGTGTGLRSLVERANAVGGRVWTEQTERTWTLTARLPCAGSSDK